MKLSHCCKKRKPFGRAETLYGFGISYKSLVNFECSTVMLVNINTLRAGVCGHGGRHPQKFFVEG